MKNRLKLVSMILSAVLLLEVASFYILISWKKIALRNEYELKMKVRQLNYEKEKKKLNDEFEENKYLLSGKDAYERIYNRQEKDIANLIEELAKESFPNGWKYEVKVEEFTNFILLVQKVDGIDEPDVNEVKKFLIPIIAYANPYLRNAAVFDRKHRCCLFFDERALNELRVTKTLTERTAVDARIRAKTFTRFNSIKIEFQKGNGHIFVPVIVSGEHGFYETVMMLDTGASMTVISLDLAQKTGREDLEKVERRTFNTAKGMTTCPIVERKISVGDMEKKQLVAVNLQENTNLLGVDFFESKGYVIDTNSNSIFVWSK